jgi:molybdopterin synthase catalytic subunit
MIEITHEPLNADAITAKVLHDGAGAVVTFLGTTRDQTGDRKVLFLEYEAYRPMADQQLARVAEEMMERWDLKGVAISHRLGRLEIGVPSLIVATSSAHRKDAYEASEYSIGRIKQIVPIWKKEFFEDGGVWVGSQEEFDPLGVSPTVEGQSA